MQQALPYIGALCLIIGGLGMVYCVFKIIRNVRVYRFKMAMLAVSRRHYELLPSYQRMLNSSKPLELRYWYTEEQIAEIKSLQKTQAIAKSKHTPQ